MIKQTISSFCVGWFRCLFLENADGQAKGMQLLKKDILSCCRGKTKICLLSAVPLSSFFLTTAEVSMNRIARPIRRWRGSKGGVSGDAADNFAIWKKKFRGRFPDRERGVREYMLVPWLEHREVGREDRFALEVSLKTMHWSIFILQLTARAVAAALAARSPASNSETEAE